MGLRVVRWDALAAFQLVLVAAGVYFIYKRFLDGYILVDREQLKENTLEP